MPLDSRNVNFETPIFVLMSLDPRIKHHLLIQDAVMAHRAYNVIEAMRTLIWEMRWTNAVKAYCSRIVGLVSRRGLYQTAWLLDKTRHMATTPECLDPWSENGLD